MSRTPKVVAVDVEERLRKAAQEARDAEEAWRIAQARRDSIVVEAVDQHGVPQNAIAKIIGVAKGRIHSILVGSQPDIDDA